MSCFGMVPSEDVTGFAPDIIARDFGFVVEPAQNCVADGAGVDFCLALRSAHTETDCYEAGMELLATKGLGRALALLLDDVGNRAHCIRLLPMYSPSPVT